MVGWDRAEHGSGGGVVGGRVLPAAVLRCCAGARRLGGAPGGA